MDPIRRRQMSVKKKRVLTFTSTAAQITPSITLSAGAPPVVWTVTESNGAVFTYATASFTHNRVTAGDYTFFAEPAGVSVCDGVGQQHRRAERHVCGG